MGRVGQNRNLIRLEIIRDVYDGPEYGQDESQIENPEIERTTADSHTPKPVSEL